MKILFFSHSRVIDGSFNSLVNLLFFLKKRNIRFSVYSQSKKIINLFSQYNINSILGYGLTFINTSNHLTSRLKEFIFLPLNILKIFIFLTKFNKFRKFNIFVFNESTMFLNAFLIKVILKKPVIIFVRSSLKNKSLLTYIRNFFLKKIDYFIAVDDLCYESLSFINKNKKLLIRNSFINKKDNIYKKNNMITIGYLGYFIKYKGILKLLESFSELNKVNKNIKLIIYGDDINYQSRLFNYASIFFNKKPLKNKIIKFISDNRLDDYIKLKNFSNNYDQIFKEIDLVCFLSDLNTYGRPVIEASAYGVPSLILLKKNFSEHLVSGHNCYILKKYSTNNFVKMINEIYFDKITFNKVSINSRMWFESIHGESNAVKFLDLIKILPLK